jgi:uncharacterized membrane protein
MVAPALPLHPVVNPFPIVTSVLAALALVIGALRPEAERREWLIRSLLLLVVGLALLPVVAWTGRMWAVDASAWEPGRVLPVHHALGGLLAMHLLGAAFSGALTLTGLLLVQGARRQRRGYWAALLVVLAAAAATGVTAHLGGRMAFGTPEAEADPGQPE